MPEKFYCQKHGEESVARKSLLNRAMVKEERRLWMTDEPENIVLEYLRQLRGGQAEIKQELSDLKFRIGSLERSLAGVHDTLAHHSTRFDRVEDRLNRIEKRFDLVDA